MTTRIEKPGRSLSFSSPEEDAALLPEAHHAARRLGEKTASSKLICNPSEGLFNTLRNIFGGSAVTSCHRFMDDIERLSIGHYPEVLASITKMQPDHAKRPLHILFDRSNLEGRYAIERCIVLQQPELADRLLLEKLFVAWFGRTTPDERNRVYRDATTIAEARPLSPKASFNLGWHRTMLKGFASEDGNVPPDVQLRLNRLFPMKRFV